MKTKNSLLAAFIIFSTSLSAAIIPVMADSKKVAMGETLNYTATWGGITIGSATTKIDNRVYKLGAKSCYKIDVSGQTNGLARLFYVNDKWTSYIDTSTVMTHKTFRSVREGKYELDEIVYFDQVNKRADVRIYNKNTKSYQQKKVYDTPECIRDVVAGFMFVRLIDLSRYKKGDIIAVNGFYEDEAYSMKIIHDGSEIIKTARGKIKCYKLKPLIPKNNLFNGQQAVSVWISDSNVPTIMQISAKMFVGSFHIELDS